MAAMAEEPDTGQREKKTKSCRFFMSWRGCRDGDKCQFDHNTDIPKCKYYDSKWGCWNGRYCRFLHVDPNEAPATPDTAQQFYRELNRWLTPGSNANDSVVSTTVSDAASLNVSQAGAGRGGSSQPKKFISRGTQTKLAAEFVHCGECGEEFKSGSMLQKSLERHYIHKMASADFHHLRFFRRHGQLRRDDPFCAACGEMFRSVEALLQHMGTMVSFANTFLNQRTSHQTWFKYLVHPFVYRDMEVLDTDEEIIQRILETYFLHSFDSSISNSLDKDLVKKPVAAGKKTKAVEKSETQRKVAVPEEAETAGEATAASRVACHDCGELFDEPRAERKLHFHLMEMLSRSDGQHVYILRNNADLDRDACCKACKKTFLSSIAVLQHISSKKRQLPSVRNKAVITDHEELLSDIVDVFVGWSLSDDEGAEETTVKKLADIFTGNKAQVSKETAPPGGTATNESSTKQEYPDEGQQMARYFRRMNMWQAKMSYSEYERDDQERTRNKGFSLAEVKYLATKGLTPDSRGAFTVLNQLYRRRRRPLKVSEVKQDERDGAAQSAIKESISNKVNAVKAAVQKIGKGGSDVQDEVAVVVEDGSVDEQGTLAATPKGAAAAKAKRKRVRNRGAKGGRGGSAGDEQEDKGGEGQQVTPGRRGKQKADASQSVKEAKRARVIAQQAGTTHMAELKPGLVFNVTLDGIIYVTANIPSGEVVTAAAAVEATKAGCAEKQSGSRYLFIAHQDGVIDISIKSSSKGEHTATVKSSRGGKSANMGVSESAAKKEQVTVVTGQEALVAKSKSKAEQGTEVKGQSKSKAEPGMVVKGQQVAAVEPKSKAEQVIVEVQQEPVGEPKSKAEQEIEVKGQSESKAEQGMEVKGQQEVMDQSKSKAEQVPVDESKAEQQATIDLLKVQTVVEESLGRQVVAKELKSQGTQVEVEQSKSEMPPVAVGEAESQQEQVVVVVGESSSKGVQVALDQLKEKVLMVNGEGPTSKGEQSVLEESKAQVIEVAETGTVCAQPLPAEKIEHKEQQQQQQASSTAATAVPANSTQGNEGGAGVGADRVTGEASSGVEPVRVEGEQYTEHSKNTQPQVEPERAAGEDNNDVGKDVKTTSERPSAVESCESSVQKEALKQSVVGVATVQVPSAGKEGNEAADDKVEELQVPVVDSTVPSIAASQETSQAEKSPREGVEMTTAEHTVTLEEKPASGGPENNTSTLPGNLDKMNNNAPDEALSKHCTVIEVSDTETLSKQSTVPDPHKEGCNI